MKLFLDSCIIIYWQEMANPGYDDFILALNRLNKEFRDIEVVVSRLSVLECCVRPLREKDESLLKRYYEFFAHPEVEVIELTADVIEQATKLRAFYNLKTPDAIQAACALSLPNETRFITNDKKFSRISELTISLI